MSSCLSGGGRTYGFELDIVKSASTSAQTLHTTTSSSSSPSSTLSESSNSPLTISTRKPRTPRKRPNQIYNEAAALLSNAYPSIFSPKHLTKNPSKFTKKNEPFYDESSVLLLPFRVIDDFGIPLPLIQEKTNFQSIASPTEIDSHMNLNSNSFSLCDGYLQDNDFDAESILEEEIEEGIIDSIMGHLSVNSNKSNSVDEYSNANIVNSGYGCPLPWQMGLGNFGGKINLGYGIKWGLRGALRPVDDSDWWRFPAVDVGQISPRISITNNNKNSNAEVKKKKKKKVEKITHEQEVNETSNPLKSSNSELSDETKVIQTNAGSGLILKLNFDNVLSAWSDRGSPFSEEIQESELAGENDVHARLAQIDLGLENGGVREASVLRYKEKRRTRLFSKKIRYQVRKVNADRRPRMKGRFVRRPNSNGRVVV